MKAINNINIEKAVVGILTDYIVFERISEAMISVNSAFFPDKLGDSFEPYNTYEGYANAFLVLGVNDQEVLCERLGDVVDDSCRKNAGSAKVLANEIFKEWLVEIKNSFIEVSNMKSKLVKV